METATGEEEKEPTSLMKYTNCNPANRVLVIAKNGMPQTWSYQDGIEAFARTLGARVVQIYPTGEEAREALENTIEQLAKPSA